MLHRDLTTATLQVHRLEDKLEAKLGEFGLCAYIGAEGELLPTDLLHLEYLAPELVRSMVKDPDMPLPFSPASDVYALAVVFVITWTGSYPFKGDTSELSVSDYLSVPPMAGCDITLS